MSEAIEESNVTLPEDAGEAVYSLLPAACPQELSVLYQNAILIVGIQDKNLYFKLAKNTDNMALLFMFQFDKQQVKSEEQDFSSVLKKIIKEIADFFGIQNFVFYMQTGKQSLLPQMLGNGIQMKYLPKKMHSASILIHTQVDFQKDSVFCKGIRMLFGIHEAELYLSVAAKQTTCIIALPKIETDYVVSKELAILLEFSKKMKLFIKGSFTFPYLSGMEFMVNCGVTGLAFRIEALAHVEEPIDLFGPFSIGDTCLMIQAGSGLEFGLYSSLYIRKIQLFGAVMLKAVGNLIEPTLLSAAISDISIPTLADNLLGEHIAGIENLDFIKIRGLPFQELQPFSMEQVREKDIKSIVSDFNKEITSEFLKLDEAQVQITPFGDGADLTDLKRMRHYYIDHAGKLKLMAQFYFAAENTSLGNYTIEKGLFICAEIEIFKKCFRVLFSLRESEGILAFARIQELDLGFIRVEASKFQKDNNTMLPIAKDSLLAQFINSKEEGLVFFLSAGKKEISFYFDGSIGIFGLFQVDARIWYINHKIALDIYTELSDMIQMSLHLSADYSSFTSSQFEFCFMLDTSGLTKKLTAVTEKIDGAIDRLKKKISDAKREVDKAQNHVNELYSQISEFDRKIAECKRAINNASWWKRAFVAIGKGAEIGAYEVAKAGIYTAIGVATAALEVARGVLNLSGKVGESVLNAVNSVIKGAMSLFYINYIKLNAAADMSQQYFMAEIDFVVIGKTYHLSKQIEKTLMKNDSVNVLSNAINTHIDSDLNHIEDGSYKSSWRKYRYKQYTVEQSSKSLDAAKIHLESSVSLIKSMQNTYLKEMYISMTEYDEMNVSLVKALDTVEHILDTGAQAGNMAALGNAMGGLKRSVLAQEKKNIYRDGELDETKKLITQYDEARALYNKVLDNVKAVRKYKNDMLNHSKKINRKGNEGKVIMDNKPQNLGKVILQVEEQVYDAFPVNRSGSDFINLSRETALRQYFMEAEEKLGIKPNDEIQMMRSRSSKGDYRNRL